MKKYIFFILVLFNINLYADENQCKEYIGKKISSKSFDYYFDKLKYVPKKKNEYETTNAFIVRQQNFLTISGIPDQFFIEVKVDRSNIFYDADSKKLTFSKFSIDNENTTYSNSFLSKYGGYASEYYDLDFGRNKRLIKKYYAQNTLGVGTLVEQWEITSKSIFDEIKVSRSSDSYLSDIPLAIFHFDNNDSSIIDKIKKMKLNSKAFALISIKEPYVDFLEGPKTIPMLDNPMEINYRNKVIFGNIKCFVITDSENHVFLISKVNTKYDESILNQRLGIESLESNNRFKTYTVMPGDTLESIARKNKVNLDDIIRWNTITSNSVLYVGTLLYLYDKSSDRLLELESLLNNQKVR